MDLRSDMKLQSPFGNEDFSQEEFTTRQKKMTMEKFEFFKETVIKELRGKDLEDFPQNISKFDWKDK